MNMKEHYGKTSATEHTGAAIGSEYYGKPSTSSPVESTAPAEHAVPEVVVMSTANEIEEGHKGWFAYIRTRNFWIVLLLG